MVLTTFYDCHAISSSYEAASSNENEVIFSSIEYDYHIDYDNTTNTRICCGDVHIKLTVPFSTKRIMTERTAPQQSIPTSDPHFVIKSLIDITDSDGEQYISLHDVYWNTYIRIAAIDSDDNRIYSQIINLNDYISESDYKYLLGSQASIGQTSFPTSKIYLEHGNLIIEPENQLELWIYNINGNYISHTTLFEKTVLPIIDINAKYIILKVMEDGKSYTIKLHI